jgi:hypothetical protein
LRRMIASREFTSIVIENELNDKEPDIADRWPDDLRQTMRQNYELKEQFNCTDAKFVYEPKRAPFRVIQ